MEENKTPEQIIAENLVYYRKASGLTQLEIAEKFNYSDKSISKWERAEGMPDIFVLKSFADFYGIKVDDFFKEEKQKVSVKRNGKHWFIVGLSELLVWLVAGGLFVLVSLIIPHAFPWWLIFVYATCASSILALVWSMIYHRRLYQLISTSCIIWTAIASLFLTLLLTTNIPNLWLLFIIGVPLEGLAILWYFLKKYTRKGIKK